jgi:hypothetical protein
VIQDGPDYASRICSPYEMVPMQDEMLEKEVVMVRRDLVRVGLESVPTTRAPSATSRNPVDWSP